MRVIRTAVVKAVTLMRGHTSSSWIMSWTSKRDEEHGKDHGHETAEGNAFGNGLQSLAHD
jgi:hypothetical protein